MSLTLLTGCSLFQSAPAYVHNCPSVKTYTKTEKAQAIAESKLLPEHSEIIEMLKDYSALHAASVDCW